jgi:hypothetical protein
MARNEEILNFNLCPIFFPLLFLKKKRKKKEKKERKRVAAGHSLRGGGGLRATLDASQG